MKQKGKRGVKDASLQALAGLEQQRMDAESKSGVFERHRRYQGRQSRVCPKTWIVGRAIFLPCSARCTTAWPRPQGKALSEKAKLGVATLEAVRAVKH